MTPCLLGQACHRYIVANFPGMVGKPDSLAGLPLSKMKKVLLHEDLAVAEASDLLITLSIHPCRLKPAAVAGAHCVLGHCGMGRGQRRFHARL